MDLETSARTGHELETWIRDLAERCDCTILVSLDVFPRRSGFEPRWSMWKGAVMFKAASLAELVDLAENAPDGRSVLLAARAEREAELAARAED